MSSQKDPPGARKVEVDDSTAQLLKALADRDLQLAKRLIDQHQTDINLNCSDKDELTPLQHACHIGDLDLARLLINHGADVNFTQRKDKYTALMFAAISAKGDIVRLLLERGVDTTAENCVNRTAADMAAFVGQSKIVSIMNCWVPYASTIGPYTRTRELEDKPRIQSKQLGRLLHNYVVYPTYHPVKFMLFIRDNPDLIRYGDQFIYVLDDLCTKVLKPAINDETASLKYHYLSFVLKHCQKVCDSKKTTDPGVDPLGDKLIAKNIDDTVRRLIRSDDQSSDSPQVDQFILDCIFKYPFVQTSIFRTSTYALSKLGKEYAKGYAILIQVLNGPRMFNYPEKCVVCREASGTKKCGRCNLVFYCDQSCQKADWFQHKKRCKNVG